MLSNAERTEITTSENRVEKVSIQSQQNHEYDCSPTGKAKQYAQEMAHT